MIRLKKVLGEECAYNRGVDAYNNRDFYSAVRQFRQAVQEHPEYADYNFALAMALRELGELDQAIHTLRRALEINPNYIQAQTELAILLAFDGKYEEARDAFQKAVSHFVYNTEDSPGAMADELLETFQMGIEQLKEGGYADAVSLFRKATNAKDTMADKHFNQALELFLNEDLEEAMVEVRQALRLDPYLIDAHVLACRIAQTQGDFDAARKACHDAVQIAPDYPDLHFQLALTSRKLGDLNCARRELEKAVEIFPDYGPARLELVDLYLEMEDLHRAGECLQDYASSGDHIPRYDYLMGCLHEARQENDKAREYFQKIPPHTEWSQASRERLESLG